MNELHIGIAFWAGILAFFSPCVLPLIPMYISYFSGFSADDSVKKGKKYLFFNSVLFVAGFSVIFVLLGATASFFGNLLFQYSSFILKALAVFLIIVGLYMLGILNSKTLSQDRRFHLKIGKFSLGTSFLIGVTFAFGWSACVGPILAGILVLAATNETAFQGMLMLAFFSLGFGLPFIVTALFIDFLIQYINKIKKYTVIIEKVSGLMLIVIGCLLFIGWI